MVVTLHDEAKDKAKSYILKLSDHTNEFLLFDFCQFEQTRICNRAAAKQVKI